MKIVYISQFFMPPTEPGSTRAYWIALELIKDGHEVLMIAQRNVYQRREATRPRLVEHTIVDGINVTYIRNKYSNNMNLLDRALSFLRFMFFSTYHVLIQNKVDLVIASSTPLTVAFPALVRKKLKGTKFIFEVRDLWPDVPIQMGGIKNKLLISFLRWFEKTTYKNASHVIALSPGMQDGVLRHISKEKTSMIPNMAKVDILLPKERNLNLMDRLGLQRASFKLIYFGQMGISNGIDYIVDAAVILQETGVLGVEFLFFGHGKLRDTVIERKKNEKLVNVHVFDRIPLGELSEVINFCDASLVTFSNIPILYTNSPNKLFDSLSAGKPVIVNSPGWTKQMVEENGCGLFVDPERPQDLVEKIVFLTKNEKVVTEMGRRARELAETTYDKTILCGRFVGVVNSLAAKI